MRAAALFCGCLVMQLLGLVDYIATSRLLELPLDGDYMAFAGILAPVVSAAIAVLDLTEPAS